MWICLALVFNGFIWWQFGAPPALEFLTGYLIEKSLSVDNLFVFVVIFGTFAIPPPTSTACCSGASSGRSCCARS